MAVEAMCALIDLDVNVQAHLEPFKTSHPSIFTWLQARISTRSLDYTTALTHMKQLNDYKGGQSSLVWSEIGDLSLKVGDAIGAFYAFQMARKISPEILDRMDRYAALLKGQSNLMELCRLSSELLAINASRPEPWVAMAHYIHSKGDLERAIVYVDKAIKLDRRHVEAHQLKGSLMLATGKPTEALMSYKKAHKICPDLYTFEGNRLIKVVYLNNNP